MCYRPIHIYNPSRKWNSDAPLRIAVPCGNCEDCRRVMRNEWFFRSVIEYRHYKDDLKGSVYFVTLTYSNEELPEIELPNGSFVPAFNRHHIRNFIKYIRVYLRRRHIINTDIKYLVCSEYGDTTKRPHYHALLFFPFHLSSFEFTELVRKCWQHGWIVCSKLGWEIKSIAGLRYASKYICKDIAFNNQPWARYWLRFPEFKESVKDFLPKHWQSVGFGEKFCEVIASQSDIPRFLANNRYTLCFGYTNTFPIPRYYHLKFEKQINKEYSKVLDKVVLETTEIGYKVKEIRYEEAVIKDMSNLKLINRSKLELDLPSPSEFEQYFRCYKERHPDNYNFYSKCAANISCTENFDYSYFRKDMIDQLPILLQNLDIFKLSLYRLFLRHFPLFEDEDPGHKFEEVSDIISNLLCGVAIPPEYRDLIDFGGFGNVYATPIADNPHLKRTPTCSMHPYFSDYEKCCLYLDMFSFCRGLNKDFKLVDVEETDKRCKDAMSGDPLYFYPNTD